MGSKFCNLNIRDGDQAAVEARCSGSAVWAVSPDWITVVNDELDWDEVRKLAKDLSKDWPVLYTEYFDDDFVDFSAYKDGKRAARYVPAEYEGVPRVPGKPRAWAELFGLSMDAEKMLRVVFRETNPEVSLRLLECVLGCPLWVDGEFLPDAQPPEQAYLRNYLARKETEKKIRNATKLTLLDEREGDFDYAQNYPLYRQEDCDRKSFWGVRDGKLECLFATSLPGRVENVFDGDGMFLVLLNQLCRDEQGAPLRSSNPCFSYESKNWAYVFSETGKPLEALELEPENIAPLCSFLDQNRLFLNGTCYNFQTHQQEWSLAEGLAVDGHLPPCRLSGGRLALLYYDTGKEMQSLTSFLPDGSERVTRELPDSCYGSFLLVYGDELLLRRGRELICYDAFLEERWRTELRQEDIGFCSMRLDEAAGLLYLSAYDLMLSFDLSRRQLRASQKLADGEDCYLLGVLPGVGAVVLTGDSTIQVWNADLNLISRHRVKGAVTRFLLRDGKAHLITNVAVLNDFRQVGNDWDIVQVRNGHLRLYELK